MTFPIDPRASLRGADVKAALSGEIPARTIGEEWASYLGGVVPKGAGVVQVEECKCAFYAGAQAMYFATLAAAGDPNDAVCEARMDALGREMSDFLRLFKARYSV